MSGLVNPNAAAALFAPYRAIGSFVATVTVREHHVDQLVITEHPVETGAAISDHAYKRSAEVTIEVGWDGTNDIKSVYLQLLALQAQRVPFNIYTGKRLYQDMLIATLETETDESTENVLMITAICHQVILVSTSTVQTPTLNAANMKSPQQTAPPQSQGTQSAKPTNAFAPGTAVST